MNKKNFKILAIFILGIIAGLLTYPFLSELVNSITN